MNLFVAATVFKKPFGLVVRSVMPTLLILCVGLLLLTYVPTLTVGPVHALRGEAFFRPFATASPEPAGATAADEGQAGRGSRRRAGQGWRV